MNTTTQQHNDIIQFAEWIDEFGWARKNNGKWSSLTNNKEYTTSQIYDLWISSQRKK